VRRVHKRYCSFVWSLLRNRSTEATTNI
jgi:hypothetical protein